MTTKVFRRNFSAHVFKMALGLCLKPCRKASYNMPLPDPRKLIGATMNILQVMKEKTCNRETFSPRLRTKSNIW